MKYINILFVLMFLLFLAAPVMAQEGNTELPDTAVEAVEQVEKLLIAAGILFGGYAGTWLMTLLKEHLPWLSEEKRKRMGKAVTQIIAFFAAEVGATFSIVILDYATALDETGLWHSIITILFYFGVPVVSDILYRLKKIGQQPQLQSKI